MRPKSHFLSPQFNYLWGEVFTHKYVGTVVAVYVESTYLYPYRVYLYTGIGAPVIVSDPIHTYMYSICGMGAKRK